MKLVSSGRLPGHSMNELATFPTSTTCVLDLLHPSVSVEQLSSMAGCTLWHGPHIFVLLLRVFCGASPLAQ